MRPKAIIYRSNTGHTRQYAIMLGEKTGLPVYSLDEAAKNTEAGEPVIFMGWLMAGKVQGCSRALRRYHIAAVCGVGMGASGSQLEDIRKTNSLPASMPVFTLQGGFEPERLRGIYRFMMSVMSKAAGKTLENKKERTPDEEDMLELMLHGGNRVSEEDLSPVLNWYESEP